MGVVHIFGLAVVALVASMAVLFFAPPEPQIPTATEEPVAATTESLATEATSTSLVEDAPTPPEPLPVATVVAPKEEPAPQTPTVSGTNDAALNSSARAALVNIFCTTRAGGETKPLSGSGVVIDPRGVVLTNAHIAQYFLLRDYPRDNAIRCSIRTGSPAKERYQVSLLYIPESWVEDNASKIGTKLAKGTGESDFALLYITDAPAPLPALAYSGTAPGANERMLLAAYPAGFLSGETIAQNLYPTSAFANVAKRYTFSDKTQIDLFSFSGSVVSQSGSSGGAAVREDGSLAGIVTTAILDGPTEERELRAITVGHIERALAATGEGSLAELLAGNVAQKAVDFESHTAPDLTDLLTEALED